MLHPLCLVMRLLGNYLQILIVVLFLVSYYWVVQQPSDDFDSEIPIERIVKLYERVISALRENSSEICEGTFNYCRRPETRHINCGEVLRGNKTYISTITGENRIPLVSNPYLNMTCPQISNRIRPSYEMNPLKLGGIAFARNVYTDYELIEKQVQMTWHPENRYCFVVDIDADIHFIWKMIQLVNCFENQMTMLPVTLYMDIAGHNQNLAHTQCMGSLLQYPNWSYLMLLQNHDIVTKTVYELDRIFEIMNGAADMEIENDTLDGSSRRFNFNPKNLKLFRNGLFEQQMFHNFLFSETGISENNLKTPVTLVSGSVAASLSRESVQWLIDTTDVTVFTEQLNRTEYGGDKKFIASLYTNSQLGMPGHFTSECIKQGVPVAHFTSMSQIADNESYKCATKTTRHKTCLFGIEDLKAIAEMSHLTWNKVYPSFDWSIIDCTAELLFNRTFLGQENKNFDEDYYMNSISVEYHRNRNNPGYKLNCTSNQKTKRYEDYL
ncbi:hypothetical protein GCK72_019748 [Caenorhabditis remanei]|uniref:Uncharacterized protein n=1 Tax=Caenorhabditis remanei TaxID=31234 RepID=A0A6A5GFD3_CAERE|nr:hypothetical protein GCK72_019748 [Caenorhabditis remanei]KAF1753192.1 hypothetical protein GCK72_019748 [Caenorhabditis remanei]